MAPPLLQQQRHRHQQPLPQPLQPALPPLLPPEGAWTHRPLTSTSCRLRQQPQQQQQQQQPPTYCSGSNATLQRPPHLPLHRHTPTVPLQPPVAFQQGRRPPFIMVSHPNRRLMIRIYLSPHFKAPTMAPLLPPAPLRSPPRVHRSPPVPPTDLQYPCNSPGVTQGPSETLPWLLPVLQQPWQQQPPWRLHRHHQHNNCQAFHPPVDHKATINHLQGFH